MGGEVGVFSQAVTGGPFESEDTIWVRTRVLGRGLKGRMVGGSDKGWAKCPWTVALAGYSEVRSEFT